jgi:hypothetical protein
MRNMRLNVSTGAGGLVAVMRSRFDSHVDTCADCRPALCPLALTLWRAVCVQAMRSQRVGV